MATDSPDSLTLLRWVERQDAEAFKELVDRHSAMVYATCRRALGDAGEAEDVAQECFESLARYQGPPPLFLGPWLHRVALNLAHKHIRGASRRRSREERFAAAHTSSIEPWWDDVYRHVDAAIDELPERLRGPLVAHFIEGKTHQGIAVELGLSRQTVTDRVGLGVKQVRALLARRGITISIPLLAGFLQAQTVEAAPATLTATLGKLALSGVRRGLSGSGAPAIPAAQILGGVLVMKKALVSLTVVLAVLSLAGVALYFYAMRQNFGPPEIPPIALEAGVYAPIEAAPAMPTVPVPASEPVEAVTPEAAPVDPDALYVSRSAFLRGRVVTEEGNPVADVAVMLERKPVNWRVPADLLFPFRTGTRSDGAGFFEFAQLPVSRSTAGFDMQAHRFHLRAKAEGLAAYRVIDLTPRVADQYVELVLRRGARLAGLVQDDQGVPVADAAVSTSRVGSVMANEMDTERMESLDPQRVQTDSEGRFALANIPEGEVCLEVLAPGWGLYRSEFFRTGKEDIVITLPRGASISGMVMHEKTGQPVADQFLLLNPLFSSNQQRGLSPGQFGYSESDGSFKFTGVIFGPYEVLALQGNSLSMQRQAQARAAVVVAEGEAVTGLKVLIRDGAAVEGRVLAQDSHAPIPHLAVWIVPETQTHLSVGKTITDAAGHFRFSGLEVGNWLLQAHNDPQRYLVTLRADQVLKNTDILVPLLAPITGRVVDTEGAPLAGATVTALGSPILSHIVPYFNSATAETDAEGRFSLSGLSEPDEVTIQARHATGVSPRVGPLRWGSRGKQGITLVVEALGSLSGVVVDRAGEGVVGALLFAHPDADASLLNLSTGNEPYRDENRHGKPRAITGAGGHFTFGRLLADDYNMEIDYRRIISHHPVSLGSGESKENVRFTIDRGPMGALEGTVTMGRPLPGVWVRSQHTSVLTDERGAYRFEDLPPGDIYLTVEFHTLIGGHQVEHDRTEKVEIVANRTTRLDIDFAVSGGTVEGTAFHNGAPARGATVEGPEIAATVDAEGRFRMEGIPEGSHALRLVLSPFDNGEIPGTRQEVEVHTNEVSVVNFEVNATPVRGQVEGLAPGETCDIYVVEGEIQADQLSPEELLALAPQAQQHIEVRHGGGYYLGNVPAGTQTVFGIVSPEGGELDDATLPQARILYQVVEVEEGEMTNVDFSFQ